MTLTEPQKLALLMLAEIHEELGIEDGIDSSFVKEAIYTGNTWALSHRYRSQVYASEDHAPEEADEIFDILDMWRLLEEGFDSLDAKDKARVEKENQGPVRMHGFDGHEDQLGIAQFIVEKMDLFAPLKGRANVDCHLPVKDAYRRMVATFKPIRAQLGSGIGRRITADEILTVLKARRGP
jgi:uncharacterized protein YfbU (UPF0304 family)